MIIWMIWATKVMPHLGRTKEVTIWLARRKIILLVTDMVKCTIDVTMATKSSWSLYAIIRHLIWATGLMYNATILHMASSMVIYWLSIRAIEHVLSHQRLNVTATCRATTWHICTQRTMIIGTILITMAFCCATIRHFVPATRLMFNDVVSDAAASLSTTWQIIPAIRCMINRGWITIAACREAIIRHFIRTITCMFDLF